MSQKSELANEHADGCPRRTPFPQRDKSHRELYPEQYTDPLCGKSVRVREKGEPGAGPHAADPGKGASGTVLRVVSSRFGRLAQLDSDLKVWWATGDLVQTK